jgi:hypothetical protein
MNSSRRLEGSWCLLNGKLLDAVADGTAIFVSVGRATPCHIPSELLLQRCYFSALSQFVLLTPESRGLPEKLTGSHLAKTFPAFYGTRIFITAFTKARHVSVS